MHGVSVIGRGLVLLSGLLSATVLAGEPGPSGETPIVANLFDHGSVISAPRDIPCLFCDRADDLRDDMTPQLTAALAGVRDPGHPLARCAGGDPLAKGMRRPPLRESVGHIVVQGERATANVTLRDGSGASAERVFYQSGRSCCRR